MGRKIEMKKIEDITKCQVTFSKRRSSLMKKANEIAICCDVDVAFVAFSPSGRVSKYSNQKRIDDVINRYVNLPASERLSHIVNVQGKMEKLKQLSHIKADSSKLHFLDKQVENLELQIKKCGLELQILEADIRDYEVGPEHDTASLHQLTWCERNLTHSLEKVLSRKDALLSTQYKQPVQGDMENQGVQFSSSYNENELAPEHHTGENPGNLDSWINPYGVNGHHQSMFHDIYAPKVNQGPSNMNIFEAGITIPSDIHTSLDQQSYMVDDSFFQFQQQYNTNAWNNFNSGPSFSDAIRMSSQTRINSQPTSKFTSSATVTTEKTPFFDEMENFLQFTQFNSNMEESQTGLTSGSTSNFILGSDLQNCDKVVQQDKGKGKEPIFDTLQLPETSGENMASTSNKQGIERQRSLSWDWENLLLDESFNFVELPK